MLDAPALRHALHEHEPEAAAAGQVRRAQARIALGAGVAQLHPHRVVEQADAQVDLPVFADAAVADAVGDDLRHQELQVVEPPGQQVAGQPLGQLTSRDARRPAASGEGDAEVG